MRVWDVQWSSKQIARVRNPPRQLVHKSQVFFFFFQAEDGIRDLTVTGVQTCALPILKKQQRNDERCRPFSGKPGHRRENPQKARHDSNMQTGHGEQMKRTRLLKRLLDRKSVV